MDYWAPWDFTKFKPSYEKDQICVYKNCKAYDFANNKNPEECSQCWDQTDISDPNFPASSIYIANKIKGSFKEKPFKHDPINLRCDLKCDSSAYWSNNDFENIKNDSISNSTNNSINI